MINSFASGWYKWGEECPTGWILSRQSNSVEETPSSGDDNKVAVTVWYCAQHDNKTL